MTFREITVFDRISHFGKSPCATAGKPSFSTPSCSDFCDQPYRGTYSIDAARTLLFNSCSLGLSSAASLWLFLK